MVIEIANIPIEVDFIYEKDFKSLTKYKCNLKPLYFIKTFDKMIDVPKINPTSKTQFYDLYEFDEYKLQVQYMDNVIIGIIKYIDNRVELYLNIKCLQNEYLLSQYAIVHILRKDNNILFMHGSSLYYKNKGFILTAKSGTGKSTHANLWRKYSDAISINDDKNVIMLEDDKLYIYPNPWSGKHMIDNNIKSSLDAIVFLYQSKENVIKKLSPIESMHLLLGQIELPNKNNKAKWSIITDKMLQLPIYYFGCNMEKEAFDVLNKRLEEDLCI